MAVESIEEQLQALDLGSEEIRVYLALLEMGRGFVSVVAKHAGVHRVNCYHLLDALASKGIVSVSLHRGKKTYQAEPPELLVKKQLERLRIAEKLLPELKQLGRERPSKVAIRPIEGKQGIKSVFEETLSSAGELLGYSDIDALQRLLKDYLYYYAEERSRRRIRSRLISPAVKNAKQFLPTYYPHDPQKTLNEIAFVDPAEFPFDSEVYIFGNKVATFSLSSRDLTGLVVESAPFAQTYRSIFNLSWLGATSFIVG